MKAVRVKVAPIVLGSLLEQRDGIVVGTTKGLPQGSELVKTRYIVKDDILILTFEHDSFEEVGRGELPPFVDIEFTGYEMVADDVAV